MKSHLVRNNKGITAIEMVFAVFISGVAILTMNIFVTQMNLENKKLSDSSSTARKNYDFLELMNNPTIWKATVLDVQNYGFFSCKLGLNPHPDLTEALDCTKVNNSFRITNGDKSILYDQNEKDIGGAAVGFTAEGSKCFGFNSAAGNDSCPTHYDVSWDLPCLQIGNCKEPMAKVSVKQITKYLTKVALNSEKTYNLNINLPQSVEIAPRDSAFMVNINASGIELDVLKTDYAVDTFNLKLKNVSSSAGSVVSVSNNKIIYNPKLNFYGVDKIYYSVEQNLFDKVTKSDGVIWVKVMTPYTWVGEGPVDETSISGKPWYHVYDKRNYCGTVVNNKCSHFNADPQKAVDLLTNAQMQAASLVFNENCVNCNVLLKGLYNPLLSQPQVSLNALEISENFPGAIKQIDDLNILIRRNSANRAGDDPALLYAFWQKGGTFLGANSKADLNAYRANSLAAEVYTQNRFLKIDRDGWSGNGPRTIAVRPSMAISSFGHFSVEGGKFYAPENLTLLSGYNQITNSRNFFHQNGVVTVYPRYLGGNLIDAPDVVFNDFVFNGTGGFDYGIVGNMTVRDLTYIQPGFENQLRGFIGANAGNLYVNRNIYLRGGGGFMVNGWAGWDFAKIIVAGQGDQYIYSNLNFNGDPDRTQVGRLPVLVINKIDGSTLHIKGDLGINTGIDYQAGLIKFYDDEERAAGDRQTIDFSSMWNSMYIKNTSGHELVLPNFSLTSSGSYMRLESDIRIAGDFTQAKGAYPFGPKARKIYVEGDVFAKTGTNEYDFDGLVTLELSGTKDQRIVGNSTDFYKNNVSGLAADVSLPNPVITTNVPEALGYLIHVDINKPGGTVTMTGAIGFAGRFRVIKGAVDASQATFSFSNTNDCCAPGYAVLDLSGIASNSLKIKALNVQRSLNLSGSTLTVFDGVNFPASSGYYNSGSVSNGTINIVKNLYYNNTFDKSTTAVNRAKLNFVGGAGPATIYAAMTQDSTRYGTYDITIQNGYPMLDCQGIVGSVFYAKNIDVNSYVFANLNNCGMKVSESLKVGAMASINRGAQPGLFSYGTLVNSGTITPDVVAGP